MNAKSPSARLDQPTSPVSTAPIVGRYNLEEVIGEGGMGVVRRAHDSGLDREVAVKLLKPGTPADSPAAARFVHEAKITGQLQHPSIPAVHDLGTLPNGLPFLAMKLVKGQTLQAMLKERATPDSDLGKFIAVFEHACHAVGYAHTHGVIHRDLKPSNVMVGAHGEVQVMDWGLAKVLGDVASIDRDATDENLDATTDLQTEIGTTPAGAWTRTGSVLGTLTYMAPEQASGDIRKLDARSDVFGLGAILCEILTGQPPYGVGDAQAIRLRAIRGDTGEALARLDASGAESALVDLCKRCLMMNQEDRPADGGTVAAAVAAIREESQARARQAEVDRERAAVQAVEERKRRQMLAVAASAVAAVLAIGAGVSAWQAVRAKTAEGVAHTEAANAQRREAQEKQAREGETKARETAEAVSKFMQDVFAQGSARGQQSPTRTANRNLTVKEAMDFAAKSVAGKFPGLPHIEAAVRTAIGETYRELAAFPEAGEQLELALAIQEKTGGPDHPDTLLCVNNLGRLHYMMGDLSTAEALYGRALEGQEKHLGPDHPNTLSTVNNMAALLYAKADLKSAEPFYRRAMDGRERVLGPDHPQTVESVNNLAVFLRTTGDLAAAEALHRRAMDMCEKTLGPDHPDTLLVTNNLAESLRMKRDYAAAEPLFRRALAGQERVLGEDHPDTLGTVNNLAVLLYTQGDLAAAEPLLQRALAGKEKALGPEHPEVLLGVNNLAVVNFSLARHAVAAPLFERALRGYEERPEGAFPAAITRIYLGLALLGAGDPAAAEPHLLAGYDRLTEWKGLSPQHQKWPRMAAQGLVELYESTDRSEKAAEWRSKLADLPPEIPTPPVEK
jgi:tetratricopeptide (TPR) repeat protein